MQICKEVNVKGQDFDFRIITTNQIINAEVTSKDLGNISERSFLNTLKDKHDQLPADGPAIILIYISQAQTLDVEVQHHIEKAISEFFRRNSRVNHIAIFSDMIVSSMGNPFVSFIGRVVFSNPHPRFEIPAFVLDREAGGKINTETVKALNGSASVASILSNLLRTNATKIRMRRDFLV